MKLFSMLGAIYDDITTGANSYIYEEEYDCLYLPVSKEFVNQILGRKCEQCGVLVFTMVSNFWYSVDSVLIDEDETPRDLREEINEYVEDLELGHQYQALSCAISNVFCKI